MIGVDLLILLRVIRVVFEVLRIIKDELRKWIVKMVPN